MNVFYMTCDTLINYLNLEPIFLSWVGLPVCVNALILCEKIHGLLQKKSNNKKFFVHLPFLKEHKVL